MLLVDFPEMFTDFDPSRAKRHERSAESARQLDYRIGNRSSFSIIDRPLKYREEGDTKICRWDI